MRNYASWNPVPGSRGLKPKNRWSQNLVFVGGKREALAVRYERLRRSVGGERDRRLAIKIILESKSKNFALYSVFDGKPV